jgi:hypothetical protein
MSTEAKIWLSVCALILTLTIAGIVFLQRTGRAGKYAWKKTDTKQIAGCFVGLILGLPLLSGLGYVTQILSKIPIANTWIGGLPILLLLNVVFGLCILVIKKIIRFLEEWIDRKYEDQIPN